MKKLFGRFKERASMSEASHSSATARRTIDVAPQIIIASARSLVEGIEQILFDSGSLSGEDTSGFHKLIGLIESNAYSEEIHIISGSHGQGCVSILLKYMHHSSFISSCGLANLAPALLHALRLLRMMEVKTGGKSLQSVGGEEGDGEHSDGEEEEELNPEGEADDESPLTSITLTSSARVCQLLVVLCGSTQIMEQLRPSLTKLLCLPLSPLPRSGVHFQSDVAAVVFAICKSGLTSAIIWALRDSQTVLQMTRALRELTALSDPTTQPQQPDILLKGLAAEEQGMWAVATSCMVDLLNAADAFSPVLLTDFESSGGFDLIVHICLHSSVSRSMQILNSVIVLLVGDAVDKPLVHPHVGEVLERILRAVLSLPAAPLTGDESVQDLVTLSHKIDETSERLIQMEYILQNMSYSLLTLYSSHPQNYAMLETVYFLLPMLTLCLPIIKAEDAFAAVLKALDFVCSERCDLISVKSLCASASILAKKCISSFLVPNATDSMELYSRFLQCITFSEEVMCRDTEYALVFFKHGLQPIFYESLSQILGRPVNEGEGEGEGEKEQEEGKAPVGEGALLVYKRLVEMVVLVIGKHPVVCGEVVESGLDALVMSLVSATEVNTSFAEILLSLPEQLARTDHGQYEPVLLVLMETVLSLGKDREYGNEMQKIKGVVDCVSRILAQGAEEAAVVWAAVNGFECMLYVIESLEGAFSSGESKGSDENSGDSASSLGYICLQSVIECLSMALNTTSKGGYDSAHDNRLYFRRMIKYPKLADALFKTSVFSSPYAEGCVSFLFKMVSGCTGDASYLLNPDGFAVIFDILPYLELGIATRTVSRVKSCAFSQIDGCQMLSEAGLIRLLVQKYAGVLRDHSHTLNPALFDLLKSVCERYLTSVDFKSVFQYLIRPDAITEEDNGQLLPVWKMEEWRGDPISERAWDSLRMLIDLTESPSLAANAAYMLLGHGAVPRAVATQAADPAHLHMKWAETQMGKPFPISNFSFTAWLQLGTGTREGVSGVGAEGKGGRGQGTVPIFALRGDGGSVFELQFDTFSSNARLMSRSKKGGKVKTHSFSIPYIDENEWHLVVITMKKQKKMIKAAQIGLELYFDGQLIHSDKFDADNVPIHGHVVDLFVGKSLVEENAGAGADCLSLWHLGPVLLFDDSLSQLQISRIMTKGATYTGSFQGESPLEGCLSTRVTEVLRRCNSTFLDMDTLLDALGLKGLEMLVFFPQSENSRDSTSSLFEDLPSLPSPVMGYNANSSFLLKSKQTQHSYIRIGLHNSASDFSTRPHAELVHGWYFSRMDSVARCLGALGGPALLMPLVQAASTEEQIVMALDLLRSCLSNESSNLNYMHSTGFGVLSFLLSRKSKLLITEKVFSALFSMVVDRGLKAANSSIFSILLVDTLAMSYLILNHQIWDPMRPEFALLVMTSLKTLVCEDARHGVLNAKRLAVLGVSRWIIMFLVFVIGECGKSESWYNDKDVSARLLSTHQTTVLSRSARGQSAAPPMEDDHFMGIKFLIQTSVYVLRSIMMMSLQRDDIELISKVIAVSFAKDFPPDENCGSRARHYLRINFVRTLGEVFTHHRDLESKTEKSKTCSIFSSCLNPAWFLHLLEKAHSTSTMSSALVLLGVMLQKDLTFRKAFCKHDSGLKILHGIVTAEEYCAESNLSVVLPLIALLFQIPVMFLPSATADATLQLLVGLLERSAGPIVSEPEAKEFTLPILSILLTFFSQGARAHSLSKTSPPVQNVIIGGLLKQAMKTDVFNSMRELMQQRAAVEILTTSLLMSSNACDDFGTRLFSTEGDLSLCLQEDYIHVDCVEGRRERASTTGLDARVIAEDAKIDCSLSEVVLIVCEGEDLMEILDMVLRNAIFKYSNPQLIYYFFLAFPSHMTEPYVCGYQALILEAVKAVLQSVFEEMEIGALHAVCDVFTLLLPLAQAGILHKSVLFDLLVINLYGLDAVASPEASNWLGLEKHSMFLKDIGSSARYFSILNFQKVLVSAESWEEKLTLLQTIRSNLHLLCLPSFEEVTDPALLLRSKRDVVLDRATGAVAIIEAFGLCISQDSGSTGSTKRPAVSIESSLQLVNSEKTRASQVFCLFLANNAYRLFLDDEKKIRNEAMRVCSGLLIHRQQFMADLFLQRNSKKGAAEVEAPEVRSGPDLHKGFLQLIPNTVGGTTMYAKLLRQVNAGFGTEDKRIAEFSFWLTDNGNLCDVLFNSLDLSSSLASAIHLISSVNSIKDLICEKVKLTSLTNTIDFMQVESISEDGLKTQLDYISEEKRQWLVYGISEIASGALHWKDVWLCQQSCPIWGNAPTSSENTVYALGGNEDSFDLTFTPYDVRAKRQTPGGSGLSWRLSSIGGPEKVCRRIEQDYETPPQSDCREDVTAVRVQEIASSSQPTDQVAPSSEEDQSEGTPNTNDIDVDPQHSDIEDFLIKISQNPLLRKVSALKMAEEGDDQEYHEDGIEQGLDNEEEGGQDEEERGEGQGEGDIKVNESLDVDMDTDVVEERETFVEGDNLSDIDDSRRSGGDGVLVEAPEDYSFDNDDHTRFSFRNFASTIAGKGHRSNEAEQLTASQMDPKVMRRGGILVEIVRGIIGTHEWEHGQMLNIDRVNGLEARKALLIITSRNVHIIDGFQMNTHATQSELVPIVWHEIVSHKVAAKAVVLSPAEVVAAAVKQKTLADEAAALDTRNRASSSSRASFSTNTRRKSMMATLDEDDEADWLNRVWFQLLHADYGHFKMSLSKVYTIFRRRYELQMKALEVTDVHGHSLLFACECTADCDATLKRLIEMNMPLSIFKKDGLKKLQLAGGGLFVYNRVTNYFLSSVTKLWQSGSMTNFDYLMHLNVIAGRSFQDLTQYPVFPWILADYESKTLDFTSSKTFRDLSKPMGALGKKRISQYEERYTTMEEFYNDGIEEATSPYFYGTHYSCAGYVLYYMLRIQPHARMAKTLQDGRFDTADRLFKAIHSSWLSSSEENLQDVRELIPEFFFLPDFLKNSNKFEFGKTQKGELVDDVVLPPWAYGDPIEFIRKQREALESKYVSEHIHLWIDLIFGYRQRGPAAKSALNLFMPLTYGGEVDVDSITDPILRAATISQINNFGQTPGRLFNKPHPKRHVPDIIKSTTTTQEGVAYSIDTAGMQWHEKMTPPLNIVGKSPFLWVSRIAYAAVPYPNSLKSGSPVGDVRLVGKDRLVAVPKGCVLLPPRFTKFIRYGKSGGGISIHTVHIPTARTSVLDSTAKEISIYEQLHPRMISCVSTTKDGELIATGGADRSVRVWQLQSKKLEHHASFVGHSEAIVSLDICAAYSLVVSGSEDRTAMVWDCSSQPKLLHVLDNHKGPVVSVSINPICGNIATLTSYELRIYNVNGVLLSSVNFLDAITRLNNSKITLKLKGTKVLAPPSGEWQQDAVVAVTGHESGHILLWKLVCHPVQGEEGRDGYIRRELVPFVLSQTHSAAVCSITLSPSIVAKTNSFILKPFDGENNYELLVGDTDGFVSRWAPAKLDHMTPAELQDAVESGKLKNIK